MRTKLLSISLAAFAVLCISCSKTTSPTSSTNPTDTTKSQTCPFGSTTFLLRDTTRIGCAVDRFNTLGAINASWAGVDTIPFLGSTSFRAWNLVLACPAATGTYAITDQGARQTTLGIQIGLSEYKAVNAGEGTVTIKEASSAKVSGSFSVTASGFPSSGTFSFIPN